MCLLSIWSLAGRVHELWKWDVKNDRFCLSLAKFLKFEVCLQTLLYLAKKIFIVTIIIRLASIVTVFLSRTSRSWNARMPVHRTGQSLASLRGHQRKEKNAKEEKRNYAWKISLRKYACLFIPTTIRSKALKHYICEVTPLLRKKQCSPCLQETTVSSMSIG